MSKRAASTPSPSKQKSFIERLMPLIVLGAATIAGFLLYRTLSRYSLDQVLASVQAVPMSNLARAEAFAAASYLCLTGFDVLALHYVGRPLPYRRVALASFVSLSLGHNIGFAALSSGAIRYRFYSRWGLSPTDVAKVILFCGITVGLGLISLAGVALLLQPALAQEITGLSPFVVLGLVILCILIPLTYLTLSATLQRTLRWRQWSLQIPSPRIALAQILLGTLNFACVAGCLHQALATATEVPYLGVASVYVIGNVTSLLSHVPGGLGVIESVVMFLLPHADLIGALIVFRFAYFLVPLALGALLFTAAELRFRTTPSPTGKAER